MSHSGTSPICDDRGRRIGFLRRKGFGRCRGYIGTIGECERLVAVSDFPSICAILTLKAYYDEMVPKDPLAVQIHCGIVRRLAHARAYQRFDMRVPE